MFRSKTMSGGKLRSHKKCKKSKKFDYNSEICKVCGYVVFFKSEGQQKLKGELNDN